ncbi:MAG: hypothetical protein JXA20_16020 [Spirochaetes bacterium]|nr:hypothetical protein [Spirochaetota bacterium]
MSKKHNLLHGRWQLILAAALLLCTTTLSVYHYHEGGRIDDKCPVCKFQVYDNISDSGDSITLPMPELYVLKRSTVIVKVVYIHYTGHSIRSHAPPSLS